MARPLRLEIADGIYHVTARGNAKQAIYGDDADRRIFLSTFERALSRYAWRCLAYCLMGNHYHLLVRTLRPNLATGMRELNGVYARRFNHRHDRCGHVFQSRYSAVLVEGDEHLLQAARYIADNPVRAGLCGRAEDWPWSSHRAALGRTRAGFVAVDELLSHFGGRRQYRAFVRAADVDASLEDADAVFGSSAFAAEHLPAKRPSEEIPGRPWEEVRPSLAQLFEQFERDEAIATAFRRFGYRMTEIAGELGCHYATVSRRLRRWEAANEMSDCKT